MPRGELFNTITHLAGTVLALAATGIVLEAVFRNRVKVVSYVLYLFMGWMAMVAASACHFVAIALYVL